MPDGRPILGWIDLHGLSVNAFDSSGIQLAQAAEQVVAKQLLDEYETDYCDQVSIARFEGGTTAFDFRSVETCRPIEYFRYSDFNRSDLHER